uniref:NADH dehydrogenase subunit 2 n=1 Tax=Cyathus pallidus TaxID=380665 RepID=UPI0025520D73|nr:NADH dehydrogenase subunit 2 [Cyathus pallidus]WEV87306.1 NADH dehydrogenase subunit 2 [Cyathus pallidus]
MIFISILILVVAKALPRISNNLRSEGFTRLSAIVFIFSGVLTFNTLHIQSIGSGIGIYSGLFHITAVSQLIEIFLLLIASLILICWPVKPVKEFYSSTEVGLISNSTTKSMDYSLIVLFSTLGSCLLISSSDLISLYLSIELQSFGVYILTTLYKDSENATSAGLKYFLLGGLSSCLILLGSGLIYSFTGLTNLESIYSLLSVGSQNFNYVNLGTILGIILIFVGFLFKVAAAPFHNWAPDVYDESPTIVTIWLTIMPKIAILILLLDITNNLHLSTLDLFIPDLSFLNNNPKDMEWLGALFTEIPEQSLNYVLKREPNNIDFIDSDILNKLLLLASLLSLIIGTILGLAQNKIKRLLTYSTISHVGFLLLALAINTEQSIDAFLFYIIQYSITNLNIFLIIIAFSYLISLNNLSTNSNININSENSYSKKFLLEITDIRFINEFKSQFFSNPFLSFCFAVSLFSMAGIPPLIGFFSKQYVLYSAVQNGYYFMSIIAIITSVISASYYIKIVKVLHEEELENENPENQNNPHNNTTNSTSKTNNNNKLIKPDNNSHPKGLVLSNLHSYLISCLTLTILLFIFKPTLILNSTQLLAITAFSY